MMETTKSVGYKRIDCGGEIVKQVIFLQKIPLRFVKYRKNHGKGQEVEKNSCRFFRIVIQYKMEKILTALSV